MKVPRKNISSKIADIKPPAHKTKPPAPGLRQLEETDLPSGNPHARPFPKPSGKKLEMVLFVFLSAISLGGIALFTLSSLGFIGFSPRMTGATESALTRLKNMLAPDSGKDAAGEDLPTDTPTTSPNLSAFDELWGKISSGLQDVGSKFSDIKTIALKTPSILSKISFLENNWMDLALNGQGDKLIAELEDIDSDLTELLNATEKNPQEESLFSLSIDMRRMKYFLDNALAWLKEPDAHNIVLFLQNPSEMRPGGGFLGSFAEISIRGGNLQIPEIRDVNEADRELKTKTVPPRELQMAVNRWRAADANWFFDFSLSAQKTLEFLEMSELYKKRGTQFEGAVAISEKTVGDVLRLTGPVELPEFKTTLTADNFLMEIQKSVQAGQAARAQEPKKILKELIPLLLQKIQNIKPEQKTELASLVGGWLTKKDAMIYLDNPKLQSMFDAYNWGGKVFPLPAKFNGSYLALVNANIDGEKTDLFLKQTIALEVQIGLNGEVSNHLAIVRKNTGNSQKYWWYNATNRNYIRIFTGTAQLVNASGFWERKIYPQINYKKSGYSEDPLLASVESTAKNFLLFPYITRSEESGKNVFGIWTRTETGATTKLSVEYTEHLFEAPADGVEYQFVFEKQAGSRGSYVFEISAPPGFVFKENGLPIYKYQSDDPPGRLIVDLTFRKAE